MRVTIVGSGPAGMTAALLLARSGHRVTLADRDPGPVAGRPWNRVGVMQFHLPHGFRPQVSRLLADRLPEVHAAVMEAGAVVEETTGMLRVRRSVFERALWLVTSNEPGVERLVGHVDSVQVADHRAVGIVVRATVVPADLVVDAGGRAGRLTAAYRPGGRRIDCGMAYAARQYRLLPGAAAGPVNGGPGLVLSFRGFQVLLFRHEAGIFTVLFVRPSDDKPLARLRDVEAFEAACRAVPELATWTDPTRSQPIDRVRAGAGLTNELHPQPHLIARAVAIGDALCTTNPMGARGMVLGLRAAATLADLVGSLGPDSVAGAMDAWGASHLRPWFDDHVAWDAALLATWSGRPVDPDGPISLETLVHAAQARHPEWMARLAPFLGMEVLPDALDPLRAEVRSMVRAGWQPPEPRRPSGRELAATLNRAVAA